MSYTRYMAIRLKARGSLIFTALLLGIQTLSAQERLWTDEDATFDVDRSRLAEDTRVLRANTDALHELLWSAPHERSISAAQSETIISIPYPDGSNHRFRIVGYDISEPDGLARYFHIRTWYGVGLDEPSRKVFLDWTERGFHAVVRGGQGPEMYIDPLSDGNMSLYRTYAAASALHPEHAFECRTLSEDHRPVHQGSGRSSTSTFGCELLQYRTAIACTDAYSNFYGAFDESQSGLVQSAVVTSVNRLNAIFTQELGLRLMLIANNDDLYFYSAADSPFTSNSLNDLFNQSIGVLDSAVGSSAFDIGHVYSSTPGGGSGVAFVASPCSFRKGQAVTIQSQGENADFLERIVAHEMGHQLGAGHTQNNNCFFDGISSVEPGSGSTIMSYSGICAPNVQPFPDQYFQGRSIKEIREFLNDPVLAGSACATLIDNGLNKPVLTPQTDERIPFGTPLVLKGEATGSESISYNWEQFDPGQAPMPPQGDSEVGPLFRSFPATDSPERFLPRLEDVLAGVDSDWEESPQVERFINFRLTVRHSNEMYGCTGEDEIRLTVDGNHGPFLVTDPANGNQWSDGQVAQVQWDVAGTDANGIDCQLVDIYISTDGGTTFTLLAEGEENDGLSEIVLPLGLTTTEARIMVRASDNVFYQVSPLDFSIVSNTGPVDISLSALTSTSQSSCFSIPEDELVFSLISSSQGGASLPLTPNLQGLPAGALVTFIPAFPRPGGSFQVLIYNMDQAAAGIYDLNLQMGSGEAADAISLELIKLDAATPPGPALVFPEDGATKIDIRPVLRVQDQGNTTYDFQLSTQPDFADLIMNKSAQPDSFLQVIPFLVGNTTYYWRARTQTNTACGQSSWQEGSFITDDCYFYYSTSDPLPILNAFPPAPVEMPIQIDDQGVITDLDVYLLHIDHDDIIDLSVSIVSPAGPEVSLFEPFCGDDEIFISYDDQSTNPGFPCPPADGRFYQPPFGQLSEFNTTQINGEWILRVVDDFSSGYEGFLNSYAIKACLDDFTALPVYWLSFEARPDKDHIDLSWSTEQEVDNRGFIIERTEVGNSHQWSELGFVPATGQQAGVYTYADVTAKPGIDYFYRLRQEDFDGQVEYSPIRSARLDGEAVPLYLFPNPVSDVLYFRRSDHRGDPRTSGSEPPANPLNDGPLPQSSLERYQLLDALGRVVQTGSLPPEAGAIDLAGIPAGVYYFRLVGTEYSWRVVKR